MPRASRGLPAWAGNLLLALGALVVSFLLLELAVRLFVDVREFAPIGVRDVDRAFPIRFLPHSERTYETSEYRYTVRFNRFGRRDVEWEPDQIEDDANVLFVGDSFVLGNGVEHEATVPTRLERWLAERGQPREVFNFGMPAGSPVTYLALLEHALDAGFAANTLLVGVFVGNDFYPEVLTEDPLAPLDERRPPRPRPGARSQLLRFLKLRLAASPRMVGWAFTAGRLLGIDVYDTAGSYIFLREPTPHQTETFDRILAFLGRMQQLARERGRELRTVIFPNRLQVENREEMTGAVFDAARPNRRIVEYCEAHGIACLDLLPLLASRYEAEGVPLYFPIDRHLNERGTRVAAEAIGSFLQQTGALH